MLQLPASGLHTGSDVSLASTPSPGAWNQVPPGHTVGVSERTDSHLDEMLFHYLIEGGLCLQTSLGNNPLIFRPSTKSIYYQNYYAPFIHEQSMVMCAMLESGERGPWDIHIGLIHNSWTPDGDVDQAMQAPVRLWIMESPRTETELIRRKLFKVHMENKWWDEKMQETRNLALAGRVLAAFIQNVESAWKESIVLHVEECKKIILSKNNQRANRRYVQ